MTQEHNERQLYRTLDWVVLFTAVIGAGIAGLFVISDYELIIKLLFFSSFGLMIGAILGIFIGVLVIYCEGK